MHEHIGRTASQPKRDCNLFEMSPFCEGGANLFLDLQLFTGLLTQLFRNCSDAIALINAESNHWCKGSITSHQRDIGTMQGGDNRDIDPFSS